MKYLITSFFIIVTLVTLSFAEMAMLNPPVRGSPQNPNANEKDPECIMAPLNGGPGCKTKPFPCGGYAPDKKIVTIFNAGDIINVTFFNQELPINLKGVDPSFNQGRLNGGLTEFALSYDGGLTYTKIATYHRTAPDVFFDWPVKIPDNAPSCDNSGQCLFSWTWIPNSGKRQFFQNCADIKIVSKTDVPLKKTGITTANLPGTFDNKLTPSGDKETNNSKGSGPRQKDIDDNLNLRVENEGETKTSATLTAGSTSATLATQTTISFNQSTETSVFSSGLLSTISTSTSTPIQSITTQPSTTSCLLPTVASPTPLSSSKKRKIFQRQDDQRIKQCLSDPTITKTCDCQDCTTLFCNFPDGSVLEDKCPSGSWAQLVGETTVVTCVETNKRKRTIPIQQELAANTKQGLLKKLAKRQGELDLGERIKKACNNSPDVKDCAKKILSEIKKKLL